MNTGPKTPAGSLIERAATFYDFDAVMRARVDADVPPPPAPAIEPAAPGPVAAPDTTRHRAGVVDSEGLRAAGFILPDAPVTALAEEFRIVKRQLLLDAGRRERGGIILVTSPSPGEGKTFCSVNLALSLANEKDIDVLLVDCDFAKPSILSTLGLEAGPGIMDAIADPAIDVESCIINTDIGGLSVLPAGRSSNEATELLASDHTRALFERLAAVPRRIVILDSPPVLAASPASALAFHTGQVVMIVRADSTGEAALREALGMLGGCDHVRLLLNGVAFSTGRPRFGAYYGYGT